MRSEGGGWRGHSASSRDGVLLAHPSPNVRVSLGEGDTLYLQLDQLRKQFADVGADGPFVCKLQAFHADQGVRKLGRVGRGERAVEYRLAGCPFDDHVANR